MIYSVRAARLAKQGEVEDARHEGERARDWAWYSVGIGLSVYIVAVPRLAADGQRPRGPQGLLRMADLTNAGCLAVAAARVSGSTSRCSWSPR